MKVAILHEGHAGKSQDNWLLEALINHQGLDLDRVQNFGMGTKSNFFDPNYKDYRALIPEIKTDQITKALFVVDADFEANDSVFGGYESSLSNLQDMVGRLGIADVSSFYICCDPATQEGNVESLLLSTLDETKKACINNFIDCSDFEAAGNSKAILNQIYRIAYPAAPFDFEHENFNELKEKLRNLFD